MPDALTLSLAVIVNGEETLLYDRAVTLPSKQQEYLDLLDQRLDKGFDYQDEFIESPDAVTRARFVASELIDALYDDNAAISSACCAWLATRLPDLRQVKSRYIKDDLKIELVFDRGIEQSRKEEIITFQRTAKKHFDKKP